VVLVLPKLRLRLLLLLMSGQLVVMSGQLVVLSLLLMHRRRGRRPGRPGLQPPRGHRPTAISSPGVLGC
jgi:hypothetical protein